MFALLRILKIDPSITPPTLAKVKIKKSPSLSVPNEPSMKVTNDRMSLNWFFYR